MMSSQESESDKMTNLPEELVVDIMGLSSMKTRAAVQMCMLSKRWNHLWPFLSALNFDLKEFNSGDPKQDKHSFSRFVTTMLNRRKAVNLDKFRLSCVNLWEKQHHSSIERWIIYAVQHQIKVLQLPVFSWCGSLVSKHIVACESLVELHLHLIDCSQLGLDIGSENINLPRLQKLHLHSQGLMSIDFFKNLIWRCPLLKDLFLESFIVPYSSFISSEILEHLTFKNCKVSYKSAICGTGDNMTEKIYCPSLRKMFLLGEGLCFYFSEFLSECPLLEDLWLESFNVPLGSIIFSQKLQNLTLKNCKNIERIYSIKAPSLVSFCFVGLIEDVVVLADKVGSISSLIHANVSLRDGSYGSSFLTYALNSLSCVENLDLCVHKLAASSQFPSIYPTLHKLKNLSICGHCFNYVLYMWKYMPNLEKITLWPYCQHYLWSSEGLNRDYALLREIMKCKKLKVLEVVCARFDDQERKLMDHLRKLKDPKIVISNKQFKN
ncbi:F-box family protein [Rhynchospora pubera]|uniref:F-box family protein n=1 Tax=Rhynchospora pubera TaxID=906938 RepID=A0AAV8GGL5_9POAL|nr:F-box family protein [Rhynchospora pubera]